MLLQLTELCRDMTVDSVLSRAVHTISSLLPVERAATFVVQEDGKTLRVMHSLDADMVTISIGSGIAGSCALTGKVIMVPDAYEDARFDKSVDGLTGFRTKSILAVPVFDHDGDESVVAVLQALNKLQDGAIVPFTDTDCMLLQLLSTLLSGLHARAALMESTMRQEQKAAALLQCVVAMHSEMHARERAIQVTSAVEIGVDCEHAFLYILDEVRGELCLVSDLPQIARLRVPVPFADTTARAIFSGEVQTRHGGLHCSELDQKLKTIAGVATRSVLCVPIRKGSRVLGVLEARNQRQEKFDAGHIELLTAVAMQISSRLLGDLLSEEVIEDRFGGVVDTEERQLLRRFLMNEYSSQNMFTASALDDAGWRSPERRAAAQQGATQSASFDDRRLRRREQAVEQTVLGGRSVRSIKLSPAKLLELPSRMKYEELHSWDLDFWSFTEEELLQLTAAMLEDAGVLAAFDISKKTLTRFLSSVAGGYLRNPYHNFQHAASVMHVCLLLAKDPIEATDGSELELSKLHLLSLLIAAIGHDIEHPGVSNTFLVNTGAPLALRYNDESVLENHHAAALFTILSDKRSDVLRSLTVEERKQVRHIVCKSILSTDMAMHAESVKQVTSMATGGKKLDPLDICSAILHLGDLSNSCLEWSLAKHWCTLVCTEFRSQAKRERELGLPVTPHLAALDTPYDIAQLQLGFIDFVVKPLWNAAALLLPEAKARLPHIEQNRLGWAEEKQLHASPARTRNHAS